MLLFDAGLAVGFRRHFERRRVPIQNCPRHCSPFVRRGCCHSLIRQRFGGGNGWRCAFPGLLLGRELHRRVTHRHRGGSATDHRDAKSAVVHGATDVPSRRYLRLITSMCPVYAEYEQIHAMYLIPNPHKPPHLHPPYPGGATRAGGAGGVVMGPDCSVQAQTTQPAQQSREARQRSKPAQQRAPCARRPRAFRDAAARCESLRLVRNGYTSTSAQQQ